MSNSNQIRANRLVTTDQDVGRRVSDFLHSRHFPALRNLEIEVREGSVTLSGRVFSYYEKQVATSCQNVSGVLSLIDQIEVAQPKSSCSTG